MFSAFGRVLKDKSDATAIEYGMSAALIPTVAITAFSAAHTKLSTMMTNAANSLK